MKTRDWVNELYDIPLKKRWITDYTFVFSKWTTKEFREKYWVWDIFINAAVCLLCKDYVRSKNWHHFNTCKCWNLSTDGWSFYTRRCFKEPNSYIDCIEYFDEWK